MPYSDTFVFNYDRFVLIQMIDIFYFQRII